MKKTAKNGRKRKLRRRPKGFLHEIDLVPVYRRFDRRTEQTVQVAYFNDWCIAQIGMSWDDIMESLLEFRHGYPEIEDYWVSLRRDFYKWISVNGICGWGVHMYPDK